jgi:DNA-binding response OmpR family regulator
MEATGKRILLVDDYEDARAALRMLLEFSGYEVRDVADGDRVLEITREWRPHAICLDLMLPKQNGFDLAAEIVAAFGDDRPLLIAVTGLTADIHREKAAEVGFDGYAVKPYDLDMLLDLLARKRPRRLGERPRLAPTG